MSPADLPHILAIAGEVHPEHPEDAAVFAERPRLYPAGCLVHEAGGRVVGYGIGHPWRAGGPPALNALLVALPEPPSSFHIHDIALLVEWRGGGVGSAMVERFAELAWGEGIGALSLVAVAGTAGFWAARGFRPVEWAEDAALAAKLRGYGRGACYMTRPLA